MFSLKNQSFEGAPNFTPSQIRFPRASTTPVSELDSKLSRSGMEFFSEQAPEGVQFQITFSDFADISLSAAHETFTIPRLDKYLKKSIDPDFATTLQSLYLSHCRALVEALRFMHIKKFVNIMGTFTGGLTAPIQQLLHEEDVLTWIQHADWAMYKV